MATIPVFDFPVQANDSGTKTYTTREAKFGDSYTQTSGDGINSSSLSWSITYSGKIEDVKKVRDFLDERMGYKSFIWKDPWGDLGLYMVKGFEVLPYAKDVFRLTTTFEQAFSVWQPIDGGV